jgi:hypothetical protein
MGTSIQINGPSPLETPVNNLELNLALHRQKHPGKNLEHKITNHGNSIGLMFPRMPSPKQAGAGAADGFCGGSGSGGDAGGGGGGWLPLSSSSPASESLLL